MSLDQKTPIELNTRAVDLTVGIVSSYVKNNIVASRDLTDLIHKTFAVVSTLVMPSDGLEQVKEERQKPAVSVKKSVQPEHLVCLECGLKFKSLKRHLGAVHDLTPDAYRQKWKLSSDYPMVAPEYAYRRSKLAKEIGLGTNRGR